MAKIYFQTYSRNKYESLQSKQQAIVDNSAETPPAERVPLSAQKKRLPNDSRSCHIVPNHRTFIEDYLKIVEFIEWLKDFYPEKAAFLMEKS